MRTRIARFTDLTEALARARERSGRYVETALGDTSAAEFAVLASERLPDRLWDYWANESPPPVGQQPVRVGVLVCRHADGKLTEWDIRRSPRVRSLAKRLRDSPPRLTSGH